jgi:hypothetical protein
LNGGNEFGMISGEPPKKRPSLHVFRMLSPVIHECDRIVVLSLPNAPRVRGPGKFEVMEASEVAGFAFFRGNDLRYLAFINFTGEKVQAAGSNFGLAR